MGPKAVTPSGIGGRGWLSKMPSKEPARANTNHAPRTASTRLLMPGKGRALDESAINASPFVKWIVYLYMQILDQRKTTGAFARFLPFERFFPTGPFLPRPKASAPRFGLFPTPERP